MLVLRTLICSTALAASGLSFIGCNTAPQLTGKWRGNALMSTGTGGMTGVIQAESVKRPVELALTLNQSSTGGITGDAELNIQGTDMHLPITGGSVTKDGVLSLEAEKDGFSTVHLTVTGKANSTELATNIEFKAGTFIGSAVGKSAMTLKPAS